MEKETEKNTAASTAVTKTMQMATNFSRSFRILPAPPVENFVENVEKSVENVGKRQFSGNSRQ